MFLHGAYAQKKWKMWTLRNISGCQGVCKGNKVVAFMPRTSGNVRLGQGTAWATKHRAQTCRMIAHLASSTVLPSSASTRACFEVNSANKRISMGTKINSTEI
eukprot:6172042-Pleurochrysis_carterae.AAC.2